MSIDHNVLAPGRNIKCDCCKEHASTFMRCSVKRCRLAWCGNHRPPSVERALAEHEKAHAG